MGVLNTSKYEGELIHGQFHNIEIGIASYTSLKKTSFVELVIPFLFERDSFQVNEYSTVTGVYLSHICFKGHHGITVEVK